MGREESSPMHADGIRPLVESSCATASRVSGRSV